MNVSSKKEYRGKLIDYSSQLSSAFAAENVLKETGHWSSMKREKPDVEYLVIEYDEVILFDSIEIIPPAGSVFFPSGLRIEGSLDGEEWKVIHGENNLELDTPSYRLDLPLDRAKYLKITVTGTRKDSTGYFAEIGRVAAGISGIRGVTASSSTAGNPPENLFDGKEKSLWESGPGRGKSLIFSSSIPAGSYSSINLFSALPIPASRRISQLISVPTTMSGSASLKKRGSGPRRRQNISGTSIPWQPGT